VARKGHFKKVCNQGKFERFGAICPLGANLYDTVMKYYLCVCYTCFKHHLSNYYNTNCPCCLWTQRQTFNTYHPDLAQFRFFFHIAYTKYTGVL